MGDTRERLAKLMDGYKVEHLQGIEPADFEERIERMCQIQDGAMEGFTPDDEPYQRDQAIRFSWGHDHDFGTFKKTGVLGERHLGVISRMIDEGAMPMQFEGASLIEIGPWTGGMTLMLAAMGAKVMAVDEVRKYVDCVQYLSDAFGAKIDTLYASLYGLDGVDIDSADFVMLSGVLYHVSDPVVALRRCFDLLKVGGRILIETEHTRGEGMLCRYCGPSEFTGGSRENMNRTGWSWFVPSQSVLVQMCKDVGFEDVKSKTNAGRLIAWGDKKCERAMCRAGVNL